MLVAASLIQKEKIVASKDLLKIEKKLGNLFADEIRALDDDALKARLVKLAQYREEIKQSMQDDEQLTRAKETAKELAAPYRDSLKDNEMRTTFIVKVLEEKTSN